MFWEEVYEFILALKAFIEAEAAYNDAVVNNTDALVCSRLSVLVLNEALSVKIFLPLTVNDPVISTDPVNWWVLAKLLPNFVDPVI